MKYLLFTSVLAISVVTGGCSNNPTRKAVNENNEVKKIAIMPVKLDKRTVVPDKVVSECSVEQRINESVRSRGHDFGVEMEYVNTEAELKSHKRYVKVEVYSVKPNVWRFPSVRPSSLMVIGVDVFKDGVLLNSVKKGIRSSVSFRACDRLDKIADAAGVYISKWSAKVLNK